MKFLKLWSLSNICFGASSDRIQSRQFAAPMAGTESSKHPGFSRTFIT